MLMRHQILLTDWQTEHLKILSHQNDLSFSEMIRMVLCQGLICSTLALYPEYKEKFDKAKLQKLIYAISSDDVPVKEKQKLKHQKIFKFYL